MHIWCQFSDSSSNLLPIIAWTSQISQNSKTKWPIWPWRSRSMTSIFNTSWEYPMMHVWGKFGDSSPNLWRVIVRTSQISYNSKSKWPKWPWRWGSMTSIFNTNREHPMIHFGANLVILAQISDELTCRQGKVYGQTDGWTDGQTDAGNDNTPLAWKAKG